MMTRAKCGIFKPKIYNTTLDLQEPVSYHEAAQFDNWTAAMGEEYQALIKNNTWTLAAAPNHKNITGCGWTYRIKRNPDGSISKYKARLAAKGYSQQSGFDFTETFSP